LVNTYEYLAFGGAHQPGTNVTVEQRHTYTGRELNPNSALMYYRYRTYDPRTGRFGARDPVGDITAHTQIMTEIELDHLTHLYAFEFPTFKVDPFGLKETEFFIATFMGFRGQVERPELSAGTASDVMNRVGTWAVGALDEVVEHGHYGWTIGASRQAVADIKEFLESNEDGDGKTCNEYILVSFSFGCTANFRTAEALSAGDSEKKACLSAYVDGVRRQLLWGAPFQDAPAAVFKENYYQEAGYPHGTAIAGMNNHNVTPAWPGPMPGTWNTAHQWIAHHVEQNLKAHVAVAVEACKAVE